MLSKEQVLELIPHRPPFLWIDRVEEIEPGVRCAAVRSVDAAEPFFAGHFPGNAILPGVLIIEAAAQTAGVMLASAGERGDRGVRRLAAVNRFKFLKPVEPPAVLRIETEMVASAGPLVAVKACIRVAGEIVASGELSVYAA